MLFGIGISRVSHSQPEPGFGGVITRTSGSAKYRTSPGLINVAEGMFDPVGERDDVATAAPLTVYVGEVKDDNLVFEPEPSTNFAGEVVPYACGLPPGR